MRRLKQWLPIFFAYFSTQTVVQLLGVAAGLLLVNFMSVREFALYTLALSVVTFFTFLSDLGSTGSLVHFFRQGAAAGEDFDLYLRAVLSLRRGAFLLGATILCVVFPRAALAKGFGVGETILAILGILLSVWFQIGAAVRLLDLRLHDLFGRSYRAEMMAAGFRLAWVLAMIACAAMYSWLGIAAGALSSLVVYLLARPSRPIATWAPLGPYRRRVLVYLLPTFLSALFFAAQGPLTVWLAAATGSTKAIAQVGALGRLGLIVGLFSGLTGVVFLPRLARITDDRTFRRRYFQFVGLLVLVAFALLAAAALLPELLLRLLGANYRGLHAELLLVIAGAGCSLVGGYVVNVNMVRSWTRWQTITVLIEAVALWAFIVILPLGTVAGVLTLSVLATATGVLLQAVITGIGFWRPSLVEWRTH